MNEYKMMSRMLDKLNKKWSHLPDVKLTSGGTNNHFAIYDDFELTIEISNHYLHLEPLSQPFWKLVLLHEYRHHIQYYDECFSLKTLNGYWNWRKDYVKIEWDADRWACAEFFQNYSKGTKQDLKAIADFLQTKKEIGRKFSRKDHK